MTIHVFAGPSLSRSPMLALDGVCAHPPIAHGDLYRLRLTGADAVLIVDGVYQHTAPIRHKEILELYAAGVPVYGTASLGALRACELHGHGMVGLGTVYGWYQDGRVVSDADVALTHGDADIDFRAFTHALVSVLSVTDRLVAAGRLDATAAADVVDLARDVHFSTRTNAALLAAADERGLAAPVRLVVDELRGDRLGDIKRIDAEAAVRDLLAGAAPAPPAGEVAVPLTSYRREWRLQHTPATADPAGPTERQVLAYAQLFLPDFPDRHTAHVFDNLRPEYPEIGFADLPPAWLDGLSPDELVRRRILAPGERDTLDEKERAVRVLVRTFRRRSGRLVYEELPPELAADLPELIRQSTRLLGLTERAMWVNPKFHPGDVPTQQIDDVFAALWRTDHLPTAVLDRGFRSLGEFREQARPYFMAARAVVALNAPRPADAAR
ncbi:TfuA domain-containing protein [Micromonospora sp. PLK6-60]|uniref:TfuA-like protein n=1 Tax=Micromonospora sp. PLK6-60 TaxID=2873383 RepID=UPI001CA6A395|nr:TfuA-like protein [Micromonospora sp. PLK6-60]MBY8870747.1 TfuA domain-containing protein [Micromonospora sp. PLK6-60]